MLYQDIEALSRGFYARRTVKVQERHIKAKDRILDRL